MEQQKNIWILPTDKPSRLHIWENEKGLRATLYDKPQLEIPNTGKNIYITSDEEIKEGDWFTDNNNSLKRSYKLSHVQFANPKKIILTTDPDLIKDGVQSIDDEFLEWFVKNPSCEEVKVIDDVECLPMPNIHVNKHIYKIIIPKEETKQEQEVCSFCGKTLREQKKGCGEITCYRQFLNKEQFKKK